MTDELFEIPESLSPRLQWIELHHPRIKPSEDALLYHRHTTKDKLCAWLPKNDGYFEEDDEPTGGPDNIGSCGFGDTEDDALRDLCRVTGTKHWSQE